MNRGASGFAHGLGSGTAVSTKTEDDVSDHPKPKPETVWTFCAVCNCVLWVETVDAHMQADHPDNATKYSSPIE